MSNNGYNKNGIPESARFVISKEDFLKIPPIEEQFKRHLDHYESTNTLTPNDLLPDTGKVMDAGQYYDWWRENKRERFKPLSHDMIRFAEDYAAYLSEIRE